MPSIASDRLHGLSSGLAVKAPVRLATTATIGLSGLQAIDGVDVAAGDRVLVKMQSDATENGVYFADTGAWTRAPDFDGARDVVGGTRVFVVEGTANALSEWVVANAGPIVIGVTALTFNLLNNAFAANKYWTENRATAGAGDTVVSIGYAVGAVLITINGAAVPSTDYVANDGATIAFNQPLSHGDEVVAFSILSTVSAAPAKARFQARLSANAQDVTGDATEYTVVCDTEDFDVGGDYDSDDGIFTAPRSGYYMLNAQATLIGLASHTQMFLRISAGSRSAQARHYKTTDGVETHTLVVSHVFYMAAGEAAAMIVDVRGSTKTADVVSGSFIQTGFSGFEL